MNDLFDAGTIAEARNRFNQELRSDLKSTCMCCKRRAIVSKLRVHSTLALMLARLYYRSKQEHGVPTEWVHIEEFRPKTRTGMDFSIVKHWKIAEPMAAQDGEDKKSSGRWRLTKQGSAFVEGDFLIPKYAFVLDDVVQHYSEENVRMEQAVNNKFSFSELMEHIRK